MLFKQEGQFSWDNSGASLGFDDFNKLNRQDDLQRVGGQGGKNCVALNCKNQNNCFWNNIPCNGNKGGYPLCEIDTTQTGIKAFSHCTYVRALIRKIK